ncbi:MAG TPA: hypothetical protein PLM14_14575 [Candidatus Hydrogenedentes bacterium]|nr:hypothetical protein [Candidatus Hydrogenedentota bacterium]HQH53299.1 hypothetical protein [Candidatus Hydrogenedentota bacterium]
MKAPGQHTESAKAHLRVRYPQLFDWVSMAFYVLLVFSWTLNIYPMGRDYVEQDLPAGLAPVWAGLQNALGDTFWVYHAGNILLLYGCMIAIFYLMKLAYNGPWWLGTLAAVLFMANPVHTESVTNLCGMVDLLPCFLALLALDAYCLLARSGNALWLVLTVPLFGLAAIAGPENIGLVIVFALFESLLSSDRAPKRLLRVLPMAPVVLAAAWLHRETLFAHGGSAAAMFGPLYFIFYPIGFLPATVKCLHESPWLGWVAAATVVTVLVLLYRKARRPVLLFAMLSILAVRVFGGGREIDPVHLIGGGQLLLANALFAVGLTSLFHRIMDHPKWRRITISGTSLLCAFFMIMQAHAIMQWRIAGGMLKEFHAQIRQAAGQAGARAPGESLLVSPDIQYLDGTPLCLSTSLVFGERNIPYRPELPVFSGGIIAVPRINIFGRKGVRLKSMVEEGTVAVLVEGAQPVDIVPLDAPPELSVHEHAGRGFRLETPFTGGGPHLLVIPGEYPWPSSDS